MMLRVLLLGIILGSLAGITRAQDLATLPSRSSWATDRLTLDNGASFEGRIISETEESFILRVGFGGTIDLPRSRVVDRLDLEPTRSEPRATTTEWFRLHDRFGTHIGTRRIVARDGDHQRRSCRMLEEILHLNPEEGRTLHVTWQESLSHDGELLGFFYREAEGDRERTLRGDFEADGRVLLEEVRNGRRRHWREDWPPDRWLPLIYRLSGASAPEACRVWDPRRGGDLVWTRTSLPSRTVFVGGRTVRVERTRLERAGITSESWRDLERGLVIYEELQGIDLRAMRWEPEADAATELAPTRHLELGYYDGLQRIAAFAPHPGWMVRLPARRPDEVITIFDRQTQAEIVVLRPKSPLESSALAGRLARELAGPGAELDREFVTEYRNRPVAGAIVRFGDDRVVRALLWEWDDAPLAVLFVARQADLDELGEDFDRFLARLRCGEH